MKNYEIENTTSGAVLGIYEGIDELAAYRSMLVDAGYDSSHKDWNEIPQYMAVIEV
jgi:hypothetical protein